MADPWFPYYDPNDPTTFFLKPGPLTRREETLLDRLREYSPERYARLPRRGIHVLPAESPPVPTGGDRPGPVEMLPMWLADP